MDLNELMGVDEVCGVDEADWVGVINKVDVALVANLVNGINRADGVLWSW